MRKLSIYTSLHKNRPEVAIRYIILFTHFYVLNIIVVKAKGPLPIIDLTMHIKDLTVYTSLYCRKHKNRIL